MATLKSGMKSLAGMLKWAHRLEVDPERSNWALGDVFMVIWAQDGCQRWNGKQMVWLSCMLNLHDEVPVKAKKDLPILFSPTLDPVNTILCRSQMV